MHTVFQCVRDHETLKYIPDFLLQSYENYILGMNFNFSLTKFLLNRLKNSAKYTGFSVWMNKHLSHGKYVRIKFFPLGLTTFVNRL